MLKKHTRTSTLPLLFVSLFLVALPTTLYAQLADSPWPMFRHDLQHTGRSASVGIQKSELKWIFQTGGPVTSSPAIGKDGTIYFGSKDKKLYAISRNGKLKWAFETQNEVDSSPAIRKDGVIVFARGTGTSMQ